MLRACHKVLFIRHIFFFETPRGTPENETKVTRRITRLTTITLFMLFILPAALSIGLWAVADRPSSWHQADWSSAGILPVAQAEPEAVIHIMSARTGGLKGALSSHSWIVIKGAGENSYQRYDKVGWGSPVRRNAYAADARWYSNPPQIIKTVRGKAAEKLIPAVETAIATYPHGKRGGYRIWPGPNSNSFIASILRKVPELDTVLPSNAVGRDYLGNSQFWFVSAAGDEFKLGWNGLLGVSAGRLSGIELNFLGLVTGLDIRQPALKLPGFGTLPLNML